MRAAEAIAGGQDRVRTDHGRSRLDRWHFGISIAILSIVIIGFSKSFLARAVFFKDPLPLYIHVHGLVMTAWFVLGPIQSFLILTRRFGRHRLIGWAGVGLALAAFGSASTVNMALLAKAAAGHESFGDSTFLFIFWHNCFSIAAFGGLVMAAILLRRRSDWHRRLLIFASVNIVAQAAGRVGEWQLLGPLDPFVGLIALVGLTAALMIADYRSLHRLHRATLISIGVTALVVVASIWVVTSGSGRNMLLELTTLKQSPQGSAQVNDCAPRACECLVA